MPDDNGCCVDYSPIMIHAGRGAPRPSLGSAADGVIWDINGYGSHLWVAWPSDDSAFLAWDRNGNGAIDNGSELFGNTTRLSTGAIASNGYEALTDLDENGDGLVDAADAAFAELRLWSDVNHDGLSEPSELRSLPDAGIVALSVDYRESRWTDAYGNRFRYRAKVVSTGAFDSWSWDVFPVTAPVAGVSANALSTCPREAAAAASLTSGSR